MITPDSENKSVTDSKFDASNTHARNLWQKLQRNDTSALEGLFKCFLPNLFDYGMKLCGHRELVEDCIQDTFAYIWEKRENLTLPTVVKSYLLAALRRNILKALANNSRREQTNREFENEIPRIAFSAEELMIWNETEKSQQEKLKLVFDKIPTRSREALYMKTYNDLSYREIAEIMTITPQVARNYVSEAFKKLKTLLPKEQPL